MKNTLRIKAQAFSKGNGIMECDNLRPVHRDGEAGQGLAPVGDLPRVSTDGWKPLAALNFGIDSSTILIFKKGRSLRLPRTREDSQVIELPEEPLCAVAEGNGMAAIVMTKDGTWRLWRDSEGCWHVKEIVACESPLSLACEEMSSDVRAYTGTTQLHGSYTANDTTLDDSDLRSLRNSLHEAYNRIYVTSCGAGAYVQPMVGFYRLLDENGRELYRSCPVVLGANCGLNCLAPITVGLISDSAGGYSGINGFYLSARPYRVFLRLDRSHAGSLLEDASSVEVCLSPQIHPVDFSLLPETRLNAGTLSMHLPGTSAAMEPLAEKGAPTVMAMMQCLDIAVSPVARMQLPLNGFEQAGATVEVACKIVRHPSDDVRRCSRIISQASRLKLDASKAESSLSDRIASPHTFGARTAAASGSTVLWGDITPRLFRGYSATEMARKTVTTVGTHIATVEVGGDRVVNSLSGATTVPESLSPLVCYPLASATSLTVMVHNATSGAKRRAGFQLMTLPGCRYSFYLNPRLQPYSLIDGEQLASIVTPSELREERRYCGALVSADSSAPLVCADVATIENGSITSISAMQRLGNSWDFTSRRFFLGSNSGMFAITAARNSRLGSTSLIRDGICNRIFFVEGKPCAIVNNTLMRYAGNSMAAAVEGVSDAGYCCETSEIWVKMLTDNVLRIYDNTLGSYYTRSDIEPTRLYSLTSSLLVEDTHGNILAPASETRNGTKRVKFTARIKMPAEGKRSHSECLEAQMAGSRVSGTIRWQADAGVSDDSGRQTTMRLNVDGAINHPVGAIARGSLLPWRTVKMDLEASPDFLLNGISITRHDR